MCGRYVLEGPLARIADYFGAALQSDFDWHNSYNIAPTAQIPVVRVNREGKRVLLLHTWGLVPHWAKSPSISAKLNNARGETVHEKPSFRHAFKRFRCLIPATGYYEWQAPPEGIKARKQPHYIYPIGATPYLAMAGVCDHWQAPNGDLLLSTAIITTQPSKPIEHIHDRMPVLINQSHWASWLDPSNQDTEHLRELITSSGAVQAHPVSTGVSQVGAKRQDSPKLIEPISPPTTDLPADNA